MAMKSIAMNLLAVIAGIVLGSVVNMMLVNVGPSVIALPAGADVTTVDGLRESMTLLRPANFVFPFLAHALGTFTGAFVAARVSANRHRMYAMGIGIFFLMGGIAAVAMLDGPMWFNILDLALAYLPMAWLGGALAGKTRGKTA